MAEIQSKEISYTSDGIEMTGYLAWDAARTGPRPGVIVVHEWWGRNDYPKKRAEMLAELGYAGFALDLYGGATTAANPDEAGGLMNGLLEDLPGLRARFNAALACLREQDIVDAGQVAAIGYCLGGGVVLHMARYGADLKAVGSFHGSLGLGVAAEGEGEAVAARLVAYHAEGDPFVPNEQLEALVADLDAANASYQVIQLPGALHGFSNPMATTNGEKYGLPLAYNELADEASWAHLQMELKHVFSA